MTILVGRHFNHECCHLKERLKNLSLDTFLLKIGDLTKKAFFWREYSTPLRERYMTLVPREAQNLSQSRFSCMLVPFLMFLLDSDEGKVKYSSLYGRRSKVRILVGRHFQSLMLPFAFERASQKSWLGHIFVRNWRPNQKCNFWRDYPTPLGGSSMTLVIFDSGHLIFADLPYPLQGQFHETGPTGGTKTIRK